VQNSNTLFLEHFKPISFIINCTFFNSYLQLLNFTGNQSAKILERACWGFSPFH